MSRLLQLVVVALAAVIAFRWRFPVQPEAAIAAISIMLALAAFLRPVRRGDQTLGRRRRIQQGNFLRPVWTGLVIAAAGLGTLEIVCQSTAWRPRLLATWVDRDRNIVEAELNQQEHDRRWQDAVHTTTDRLTRPASEVWSKTLENRRVYEEIHVAVRSENVADKLSTLEERLRQENHDTSVIQRLLNGFNTLATYESAKLDWQIEREVLERSGAEQILHAQLEAARQVERYPVRSRRWLDGAAALANRHGINDKQLAEMLASWQGPIALPESVTIEVLGAHSTDLITTLDLIIESPDGSPFLGLSVRDFSLTRNSKALDAYTVAMTTVLSEQLQLAVLIDCSSSTRGQPIQQAIAGASLLLKAMAGVGGHRVWKIGTDVTPITEWSDNSLESVAQLDRLKADGMTALLQGVNLAQWDVGKREGKRVIVIFSDGKNTVSGPPVDRLIAGCRTHAVAIFVVALQTADLDLPLLQKLSAETGGQLFVAANVDRLLSTFELLIAQLRRPTYRLIVLSDEPTDEPLDIQIGGHPSRHISVTAPAKARNLTTQQTAKPQE
jgi:hypothetical protein